ncbi:MAG: DUF2270 domain-containing protein [Solirubrobacterales bacterium]
MTNAAHGPHDIESADIAALAHLYRGELYRSTVWRTRLDTTTNWAVVTTGLALSLTYSSDSASALPLVLVGLLVTVFLSIEARRYRFFDFWRIRAHILEVNFFGPILLGRGVVLDNRWNEILYKDYIDPQLHITFAEAAGRRLRRNYSWIFLIQLIAYIGKLLIHPVSATTWAAFVHRATIGPIPGEIVLLAGVLFHGGWMTLALVTMQSRRGRDRPRQASPLKDSVLDLARTGH